VGILGSKTEAPCHRAIPFADLYSYCLSWHSLADSERWLILRTQHQVGDAPTKLFWSVQGHKVCFTNFCHLIAVGPMTIRKHLKGDIIPNAPKACTESQGPQRKVGRPRHQGNVVDFFFMELYNSSSEPLAKSSAGKAQGPDEAEVELSHGAWFGHNSEPDLEEAYDWDPQPPDVSKFAMLTAAADGLPVVGVRERYIQSTKLSILYWQFLATWETLKDMAELKTSPLGRTSGPQVSQCGPFHCPPPCYTTFVQRYNTVWKHYIKIRTPTEHAQCTVCFRLQAIIADGTKTIECRRQAAQELQEHHRAQYRDRLLYWNLRLASQCESDVLVIIIDAMDKAKFAWPRWPWHRRPHDLDDIIRPKMNFTAVLAHGYLGYLFMSSEVVSHGSDFCIEAIARTIQAVYEMCKRVAGIGTRLQS